MQHDSTNRSLPLFYMSDYSVLGIRVDKFQKAIRILKDNEFQVNEALGGVEVALKEAAHIQEIFKIFETHDIDGGIADIVDQIYQG